jgi:hypothetical protein
VIGLAKKARAEALAAFWRARYWAKQSRVLGKAVALSICAVLLSLNALVSSLRSVKPEHAAPGADAATKKAAELVATAHTAMHAIGWIVVAIGLANLGWMGFAMVRRVRAAGGSTEEKIKLEKEIAQLRGSARAKKEAELILAEIGATNHAKNGAEKQKKRVPKRI